MSSIVKNVKHYFSYLVLLFKIKLIKIEKIFESYQYTYMPIKIYRNILRRKKSRAVPRN